MASWEEGRNGGQPEVSSCGTLLADPSTVSVPLIAPVRWVERSALKVRPYLQAEEDEASGVVLKASIIFPENTCCGIPKTNQSRTFTASG